MKFSNYSQTRLAQLVARGLVDLEIRVQTANYITSIIDLTDSEQALDSPAFNRDLESPWLNEKQLSHTRPLLF